MDEISESIKGHPERNIAHSVFKLLSDSGGLPPHPPTSGFVSGPHWGHSSQTLTIGSLYTGLAITRGYSPKQYILQASRQRILSIAVSYRAQFTFGSDS